MTTVAEWEELNSSQEEIQSIYTCSSFITECLGMAKVDTPWEDRTAL